MFWLLWGKEAEASSTVSWMMCELFCEGPVPPVVEPRRSQCCAHPQGNRSQRQKRYLKPLPQKTPRSLPSFLRTVRPSSTDCALFPWCLLCPPAPVHVLLPPFFPNAHLLLTSHPQLSSHVPAGPHLLLSPRPAQTSCLLSALSGSL